MFVFAAASLIDSKINTEESDISVLSSWCNKIKQKHKYFFMSHNAAKHHYQFLMFVFTLASLIHIKINIQETCVSVLTSWQIKIKQK